MARIIYPRKRLSQEHPDFIVTMEDFTTYSSEEASWDEIPDVPIRSIEHAKVGLSGYEAYAVGFIIIQGKVKEVQLYGRSGGIVTVVIIHQNKHRYFYVKENEMPPQTPWRRGMEVAHANRTQQEQGTATSG